MYLHSSNFSLDTATFTKPVDFKVEFFFFFLYLREIAKFSSTSWNRKKNTSTHKIDGIPKSQNVVLANNSNNKVHMAVVRNSSWYPKFNGSHFGLPPSSIHKMTRLGGKMV